MCAFVVIGAGGGTCKQQGRVQEVALQVVEVNAGKYSVAKQSEAEMFKA